MGATQSRADAALSPAPAATTTIAAAAREAAANKGAAPSPGENPVQRYPPVDGKPAQRDRRESAADATGLVAALAALDAPGAAHDGAKAWWRSFPRSELPNPGAYEDMNQEATMILRQNTFEGLQFNMTMPIGSQAFSMGQTVEMGAKDHPGAYAFAANYFSNRLVMISRVTPADGRVNGRIFYTHTPSLTSKFNADVGSDPDSAKASWDLDYRGEDFCSQLKIANGGIAALSYLQSVTPTIAIGGEGFFQGKSGFSAITAAAKYANGTDIASITVASFGPVIASYMHRVNPRSAFATEIFIDGRSRDSHVSCGYRFDLTSSSVMGNIDSSGRISATVEERINPVLSFLLSGELDHQREEYRFGFGVNIGGN
jgi:mitochondrial import receptor subunit TOM40